MSEALPNPTADATAEFTTMLSRLRAVDHFAVGRRVLAIISLGWLSQLPVREVLLGHALSRDRSPESLGRIRHMMSAAAGQLETETPSLAGVFSDVLVPDIFQSQVLEQGAVYAATMLEHLPTGLDRFLFGRWFSDRLDQIVAAGPAATEVGTPQALADFMIALARISPGQSVYDPCCGLGGLLARAAGRAADGPIHGADVHPVSWAFASLRLCLLDAGATVERRDSLRSYDAERFDRVVCDPPLGPYLPPPSDLRADRGRAATTPSRRLDALFLEKSMNALGETGRAVVLVSQSTLFRRGHEQDLRARMLETRSVHAVIGLPPGAVAWTAAELALVVLDRAQPHGEVLFLDGAQARQGAHARGPVDYGVLLDTYAARTAGPWLQIVAVKDLTEDNNLVPRRRIEKREERPGLEEMVQRYQALIDSANGRIAHIEALIERLKPDDD